MADDTNDQSGEGEPSAVETEARQLGWVPQDQFRGDPNKWTDAETFVKRGKEQLPILSENNRRLKGDVTRLTGQVQQLQNLFNASQESITELKRLHEETFNARVNAEKARLRAEIKTARESDDLDAEEDAREELSRLSQEAATVTKDAKKDPPKQGTTPQPPGDLDPHFVAWQEANSDWLEVNMRKTAVAFGLAQEVRRSNPNLVGKKFYDALDAAIEEVYPTRPPGSKTEEPRGGGGKGGGGGKDYDALPPDAKQVCNQQAKKFVGAGRAFKTDAEWRTHYAKVYFQKEAA